MKLLYCSECGDIISPHREVNKPRWCSCNTFAVWWVDPDRGILRVYSYLPPLFRHMAYVLGINNSFLTYPGKITRDAVEAIDRDCPGNYLFKQIGSPLIRIRPGETNDTAWAQELPDGEIKTNVGPDSQLP